MAHQISRANRDSYSLRTPGFIPCSGTIVIGGREYHVAVRHVSETNVRDVKNIHIYRGSEYNTRGHMVNPDCDAAGSPTCNECALVVFYTMVPEARVPKDIGTVIRTTTYIRQGTTDAETNIQNTRAAGDYYSGINTEYRSIVVMSHRTCYGSILAAMTARINHFPRNMRSANHVLLLNNACWK